VARNALDRTGNAAPGTGPDLTDLLASGDLEQGLVVLAGDTVVAVAGAQRTAPSDPGFAAALTTTPFVRTLMVAERRGDRVAQVSILLHASAALPAPGASLDREAGAWQRVAWRWRDASGTVPAGSAEAAMADVERTMTAVAPSETALASREALLARWLAVAGLAVVAVVVLTGGAPPVVRAVALLVPVWVIDRAGLTPPVLGTLAMRALLVAAALLLLAVVLWRRPARRNPIGLVAAGILLAMAPLLVALAASRLAPGADPDSIFTWFGWQAALALGTAAYMMLASAPLRGGGDAAAGGRWGGVAIALATVVGVLGIVAWQPGAAGHGWPVWYIPLWLLPLAALLPVMAPTARRLAVMTTAGVLAALTAWGASLDQRMTLAADDLARAGATSDTLVASALTALADTVQARDASRLPALYAAWHDSPLFAIAAPTQLAIWRDSTVAEWVALDSLSASWNDLTALVQAAPRQRRIVTLARGVGRHQVLVLPLAGDTTVTVLIGPRTRLVRPTRFGRLVGWRSPAEPAFDVQLVRSPIAAADGRFRRSERFVQATDALRAGGVPMTARATIAMSTPRPFVVRASLTVLLDLVIVLLAWRVMRRALGSDDGRPGEMFRRSYRRTVAGALISFFVVPAAFFTLWSALRLRQDVNRQRSEEVGRALREVSGDAAFSARLLEQPEAVTLAYIAERADAEFGVYRRGRLVATSLDLLPALGVLPPVLDPALVRAGGPEAPALSAPVPGSNVRLSAEAFQSQLAVAAALPGVDVQLARGQLDLALLLLLASLGGTFAAVAVAGAVARALGQPIEALRQRAIAIGRREPIPVLRSPPAEFEPVFGAIEQMEQDLHESESRLEEETARTARIVAWGEMARQVAHEIKNPLTPMRLGLQHLRRLGRDGQVDLAEQVDATVERLLAEIDRLDRIARSFARYGTPPERDGGALEAIALAEVAAEIAQLFTLAASIPRVVVEGDGSEPVAGRREELLQVLLNLLDNARAAGATRIVLRLAPRELLVIDDGRGIPPEQLERVFEPTFSTTTSGTGLGLAIVRRLVDGWGATIAVTSRPGEGTTFSIRFAPAGSTPPGVSA
jgi:signal transduction histidine kinase